MSDLAFEVVSPEGVISCVACRADAIEILKEYLNRWMNPTDHIGWFFSDDEQQLSSLESVHNSSLPDLAFVVDESGETTDAWACIKDVRGVVNE